MKLRVFLACLYLCIFSKNILADTLVFWHSMTGPTQASLEKLIAAFEKDHPSIHIQLEYKGNYNEIFDSFLHDQRDKPHILQVAEYQTESCRQHAHLFRAVDMLISDLVDALPYVSGFYSSPTGRFLSLPFNVSMGSMIINQHAWEAAGLDSAKLPSTWTELIRALGQLKAHGFGGLSTAWPAAYLIEHIGALHGVSIQNGSKIDLQHSLFSHHLDRMIQLAKKGLYTYGGRFTDAETLFTSQQVSIFLQGANRVPHLSGRFPVLIAPLPFDETYVATPFALNIGGASLWVTEGHSAETFEAISTFLKYLATPQTQLAWTRNTNYLPVTTQALEMMPDDALKRLIYAQVMIPRAPASNGIQIADYARKRALLMDAIEDALVGLMSPQKALTDAQEKMNSDAVK